MGSQRPLVVDEGERKGEQRKEARGKQQGKGPAAIAAFEDKNVYEPQIVYVFTMKLKFCKG